MSTTTSTSTVIATIRPMFSDSERLALAGFLAGYRGLKPGRFDGAAGLVTS
jgi:hypothetical protein